MYNIVGQYRRDVGLGLVGMSNIATQQTTHVQRRWPVLLKSLAEAFISNKRVRLSLRFIVSRMTVPSAVVLFPFTRTFPSHSLSLTACTNSHGANHMSPVW